MKKTEAQIIKAIRRDCAKLIRQIRKMQAESIVPPPDPTAASRAGIAVGDDALCKANFGSFDIRTAKDRTVGMRNGQLSLRRLAGVFGVTGQALHALERRNSLTRDQLADPDQVFAAMLKSKSSALRTRLADPRNRLLISNQIKSLTNKVQ